MKFAKGQSGNPAGRPRGSVAMARLVQTLAKDGDDSEIVAAMYAIARSRRTPVAHRLRAWGMLADRRWGRPVINLDVDTREPETQEADYGRLSYAELEVMEHLYSKVLGNQTPRPDCLRLTDLTDNGVDHE